LKNPFTRVPFDLDTIRRVILLGNDSRLCKLYPKTYKSLNNFKKSIGVDIVPTNERIMNDDGNGDGDGDVAHEDNGDNQRPSGDGDNENINANIVIRNIQSDDNVNERIIQTSRDFGFMLDNDMLQLNHLTTPQAYVHNIRVVKTLIRAFDNIRVVSGRNIFTSIITNEEDRKIFETM